MDTNKYAQGKIYKLTNTIDDLIYVGSTYRNLKKRFQKHKEDAKLKKSKVYTHLNKIGWENVSIELLEDYPCQSKAELCTREREYIEQLQAALNNNIPIRKADELYETNRIYREKNKDIIKEKKRLYRIANHDKELARGKVYRENNRDKVAEKNRRYYENNREKEAQRQKDYKLRRKLLRSQRHIDIQTIQTDIRQDTIDIHIKSQQMDVQQATQLFTNAEQLKHFKDQVKTLNVQPSTNLQDFFNIITQDTLNWLSTLPKGAQKEDALRKYKTPLNTLLNNKQVQEALGQKYCETTRTTIKQGYKDNIDSVIQQRSRTMTLPPDTKNDDTTNNIDEIPTSETCDDTESESEASLALEDIEYQNPKDKTKTIDDYKSMYEKLKQRYEQLEFKHKEQQALLQELRNDKAQMFNLMNKLVSK